MVQNEDECLTLMVELAAELAEGGQHPAVGGELVEFLLGDKDGSPKVITTLFLKKIIYKT